MTRCLALLVALAALVACDGGRPAPAPGARATVVRHAAGETAIVGEPRRVVALAPLAIETLVALGVRPVGVTYWGGRASDAQQPTADFPPYLAAELAGTPTVGSYGQPSLEAILALAPDLIVGTDEHLRSWEALSGIAPTILLPGHDGASGEDTAWRRALTTLGSGLRREDAARARIAEYDDLAARARERLRATVGDATVLVVRRMAKGFRVSGPAHGTTGRVLYRDLGLRAPAAADAAWAAEYVPLEGLASMDPGWILLVEGREGVGGALLDEPIWRNLSAVRGGRVRTVSFAWIRGHGWYGKRAIVDEAVAALAGPP